MTESISAYVEKKSNRISSNFLLLFFLTQRILFLDGKLPYIQTKKNESYKYLGQKRQTDTLVDVQNFGFLEI